ncbi:hypothetical protein CMI48_02675 [Candidatus Pacearchaeota archaeon]|nr:hypothetical protein [Candidatus Pacearchaeota archaeon]
MRLRLSEGRDIFLVVEAASPGAEIKGSQGKGAGDRTEYLAWQDSGEIQETVENLAISRPKDSGISTSFFDKQGVRIK